MIRNLNISINILIEDEVELEELQGTTEEALNAQADLISTFLQNPYIYGEVNWELQDAIKFLKM